MALAMLGLVFGSALLLACILILLDRATRPPACTYFPRSRPGLHGRQWLDAVDGERYRDY